MPFVETGLAAPAGVTALAVLLVVAVAAIDVFTGPSVDVTLLYMGAIGLGTFFAGLGAGLVLAILSLIGEMASWRLSSEMPPAQVLVWNAAQHLGIFLSLAVLLDAFKRRLLQEQLAARTDPLTSLANRRAFVESAWAELERVRRSRRPITLVYLDADDFKVVNDRFGHLEGDAFLAAVATTLRGGVRAVDTVARLGGDEFAILLPEVDSAGARVVVERLRHDLMALVTGRWDAVTFSIGVASFFRPPESVDEMILRADELMYAAKRSGKNCWRAGSWGTGEIGE